MKLQYLYKVEDRLTYCFVLPEYDLIETAVIKAIMNDGEKLVSIGMGIARCHPSDRFVKSTGKELSYSNIESVEFKVKKILMHTESDEVMVWLFSEDKLLTIRLVLKTEYNSVRILSTYEEQR